MPKRHGDLIAVIDITNLVDGNGGHQGFQTGHQIDLQHQGEHKNPGWDRGQKHPKQTDLRTNKNMEHA